MNVENVRREDWIIGGVALLLLIDLLAFPWFSGGGGTYNYGGIAVNVGSIDLTATDAPDGWTAILAVIAAIALLAYVVVDRLVPQTQLPTVGGSRGQTKLILAAVVVGFMVLKFLLHIHFSIFGWGFWLGVPLAAVLVVFSLQARQAETLAPRAAGPPPPPPPPPTQAGPPPAGPPPTQAGPPPS